VDEVRRVVEALYPRSKAIAKRNHVRFVVDAMDEALPAGDVIFIREVLHT
jgi:hypothetical protein